MSCASGNILNDLRDLESDRGNHPERPLVTGELTPASARTVMTVLFVASLLLILPIAFARWELLVIWAAAIGALLAYELRLKAEGLSGNAMVAFLTAGVFLYGAAAVGNPLVVAPFALMAFFATLSREVIKDMEDADGDIDRRTLPRTSGMAAAAGVARVCAVVAILLSPIPVLGAISATSVGGIIYLSLVATTDALFVVSVASLPHQLHRAQSISKGAMTVALAAFVAFAIR
ncbi:MAG: geranylgeranylglycerol-phosphate geranylgeranyltransferase [Thermoplasmata archaeon]|nr:geranylgeranylglycerol-phosphate geranylgeranyltransferase [Thermoplasmata archaeon]